MQKNNWNKKENYVLLYTKMKDTDEWALCGLYNHHYIHKNDPKYQDIENDKCNLEESCENAKLAIAQLLDEENELSEHLKQLQNKLVQFFWHGTRTR